jgi:hypothetical protein
MNLELTWNSATWYHPVSNQEVGVAEDLSLCSMYQVDFIVPGSYWIESSLVNFTFAEREVRAKHATLLWLRLMKKVMVIVGGEAETLIPYR